MDNWITVPEAARRLGVTRQWVFRLCQDGRITGARKIGRQWVIPAGAKIETLPGPRLRTTEIPRAGKKGKRMIEIAKKQSLR